MRSVVHFLCVCLSYVKYLTPYSLVLKNHTQFISSLVFVFLISFWIINFWFSCNTGIPSEDVKSPFVPILNNPGVLFFLASLPTCSGSSQGREVTPLLILENAFSLQVKFSSFPPIIFRTMTVFRVIEVSRNQAFRHMDFPVSSF